MRETLVTMITEKKSKVNKEVRKIFVIMNIYTFVTYCYNIIVGY